MTPEGQDGGERASEETFARLPNGIRKHIRRIKRERGKEVGLVVRRKEIEKAKVRTIRRRRRAEEKIGMFDEARVQLDRTLREIETGDNSENQARKTIRATFLLGVLEEIGTDQKMRDIEAVLERYPALEDELPQIRDGVFDSLRG